VDPDAVFTRVPFRPCVHCVWDVGREGFYVNEYGEQEGNVLVYLLMAVIP
jgi:hypothetical protein